MFGFLFKTSVPNITPEQVKKKTGKPNVKLIDVRTPEEYHANRIPGSINIPLNSIRHITQLIQNKDSTLIVYCLSGSRASTACSALVKMGYTAVYNLGGISQWPYETVNGKEEL